jgi:hypothetical protein
MGPILGWETLAEGPVDLQKGGAGKCRPASIALLSGALATVPLVMSAY